MCGIFAVHNLPPSDVAEYRSRAIALSKRLRHRGPDWTGCVATTDSILCHERLAIVGVDTGAQPLTSADKSLTLAVNGEIYNYKALRKSVKNQSFQTQSDCEVIMYLYQEQSERPADFCKLLDGMFSFVLVDSSVQPSRLIAARDPIGITTLYQGWSSARPGTTWFASELKSLHDECDTIRAFPPGHVFDSSTGQTVRYYEPTWFDPTVVPSTPVDYRAIRTSLESAVRKRLMSEVPYGVLLSGGLDSSLIAAIAARETRALAEAQLASPANDGDALATWPRLHSFSIGLEGSPDLLAARVAAKYLKTVHHEYTFTVQEGLDAVPEVVYHLETYDVTTVRASTPMYLLSRKIKAMGVKMVLSGEGSDEVFGGYLYFHAAPDAAQFHRECVSRVQNLHYADCLRANKSTMAWGLEARVPFLDKSFLDLCMNIDPTEKQFAKTGAAGERMEKYILRKAFDTTGTDEEPYLPDEILWRQKEQFSDGVGYSWIDGLKEHSAAAVSDAELAAAATIFPDDTPDTKEALYIRKIFESHFPEKAPASTVSRWIPREDWGCSKDPSGRAVAIHDAAYNVQS